MFCVAPPLIHNYRGAYAWYENEKQKNACFENEQRALCFTQSELAQKWITNSTIKANKFLGNCISMTMLR